MECSWWLVRVFSPSTFSSLTPSPNPPPPQGVYDDPKCAAAGIVDHAVLVVGYEFTGPNGQGNWIVRNSWGTKWGEQGHMRMAFAGSVGICGIHSVPAIYPIIQVPSPCDSPQKPCGGGVCVPEDGGYSCQCPASFVSFTNDDGTATCALSESLAC
ncbi:unnamed protein product [Closterium sp. NIES-54]